ncbi:MAG: trypsin-like peptidase domain-containing protein [Planctomycetaceae bacterium]|nr:trypsin-like peptidase domain-containing protein [Planctomycetaceae bacterium]
MKHVLWWCAVLLVFLPDAEADVSEAIVIVDGCSGVCVDPNGIVLTAKHCDLPREVTVRFKQRSVRAIRVYESHDTEGPVAYDCDGDGYPSLPVAVTAPAIAEKLWSFGYPSLGGQRELRRNCGPLLRWGTFKYAGGEFTGNVLGFACGSGWSGGPLLNAKGEVCGLLNSSDDRTSVFISSAAVRQAYAAARQQTEQPAESSEQQFPQLLVFGTPTCSPCLQFKADLTSNRSFSALLRSTYELVWVDINQRPEMAKKYAIEQVPVFISEQGLRIVGYTGPEQLLMDLGLRTKPDPAPPPVRDPVPVTGQPEPQPTTEPSSPVTPPSDPIDRLTSLTQHAISIATWLGVTGLSGGTAGILLGGLALWRTLRRRRPASSIVQPPINPPPTITHDSAPLPQAIVPETRFAAYERDSHAEAFAWAAAEMARKYPGVVSTLESLQGLINQYLASRGIKRPNKP